MENGDPRASLLHKGGARAGEERLAFYFWESKLIESYKETRNGLIGPRYSTQFSHLGSQSVLYLHVGFGTRPYVMKTRSNQTLLLIGFDLSSCGE